MTVVQLHGRPGAQKTGVIAALDIGSTKISCLIAEAVPPKHRRPRRRGAERPSHPRCWPSASRGVRAGAIINVDEAERAIRLAVDAAERMAQRTISEVYVNVSGGRPQSRLYQASEQTQQGQVSIRDMEKVLNGRAWRKSIPAAAAFSTSRPSSISSTT